MFLARSLEYGGTERQLVTLAKGLQQRGWPVTVAVFYEGGPLENELHAASVSVVPLHKGGRWDVLRFLARLSKVLQRENPALLYSFLSVPNIISIGLKPLFPKARRVWGVRASNMDLRRYDWLSRFSYRVERGLARFTDLVIANSRAGWEYAAAHGFPKDHTIVIPNGIDTVRFHPDHQAGVAIKQEWGVAEHERLIGLVARLDPMKDHPTFLRATAILAEERPDVRFVCIGDGPQGYREQLLGMAAALELKQRIIWARARTDMVAVYNALDILSLSSCYGEGFPNVIGEAMACGVPCVVTDVGDSAYIVGDTGVVVPPRDPAALARGWAEMIDRIESARPEVCSMTRARIVENFSADALIQRTEKALEELID